jgi:hypothetical protein
MATMLYISRLQEVVTEEMWTNSRQDILKMCRMLSGLKRAAMGANKE